jgi:hypothetical protein
MEIFGQNPKRIIEGYASRLAFLQGWPGLMRCPSSTLACMRACLSMRFLPPSHVACSYSEEFERCFMEHLKRAHPFSRIAANVVYNEYINDRNHVHMNSTKWLTLTEFVKHLGRTGQCKVEETPKGWFITLIHRDEMEVGQGFFSSLWGAWGRGG